MMALAVIGCLCYHIGAFSMISRPAPILRQNILASSSYTAFRLAQTSRSSLTAQSDGNEDSIQKQPDQDNLPYFALTDLERKKNGDDGDSGKSQVQPEGLPYCASIESGGASSKTNQRQDNDASIPFCASIEKPTETNFSTKESQTISQLSRNEDGKTGDQERDGSKKMEIADSFVPFCASIDLEEGANEKSKEQPVESNIRGSDLVSNTSGASENSANRKTPEQSQTEPKEIFVPSPIRTVGSVEKITKDREPVRLSPSTRDEMQNVLNQTSKVLSSAISFAQGLPSKVKDDIEKSQKVIQDVREFSDKVSESVEVTKYAVEETLQKTQKVMKGVEANVEKTQQVMEDVKEFSGKVNKSVQETKGKVEEAIEKTEKVAKEVQEFQEQVKESVDTTQQEAKVLLGFSPDKKSDRKVPTTAREEARELAGKATAATVQATLSASKGVGTLAWKGAKKVYNNTIGPVVEEAWNEQIENINNSINATTKAIQDIPSKMIEENKAKKEKSASIARLIAKSQEEKEKEKEADLDLANEIAEALAAAELAMVATPEMIIPEEKTDSKEDLEETEIESVSKSDASAVSSDPVEFKKEEEERTTQTNDKVVDSTTFDEDSDLPAITKQTTQRKDVPVTEPDIVAQETVMSAAELERELEEVQKMVSEISNSLDAAERAMNMKPNEEMMDPIIQIEKMPPVISKAETFSKKNRTEENRTNPVPPRDVIARFETAKTQDDLDAEFEEAQALAREIASALQKAEKTLVNSEMRADELTKKVADVLETAEQTLLTSSSRSSRNTTTAGNS